MTKLLNTNKQKRKKLAMVKRRHCLLTSPVSSLQTSCIMEIRVIGIDTVIYMMQRKTLLSKVASGACVGQAEAEDGRLVKKKKKCKYNY